MKKLMLAAVAAVAVAGSASATLVYDYKSSVRHMYEKLQRVNNTNFYVKYVKSSKLEGFFVQDNDGLTTFAKSDLVNGYNGTTISNKRGFLVVLNKSAESAFRAPKILPAQLDVKGSVTKASSSGATTRTSMVYEAYFYAGPFASAAEGLGGIGYTTEWDSDYDNGVDYMFYSGINVPGAQKRAYGTFGSTLYLFGQHNTYNRFANTLLDPAGDTTIHAFGDAWLNGAGFGTGRSTDTLCCGWGSVSGGFGTLSGNLKGGLFLCSIGGYIANSAWGYFALGLEDVFAADVALALGHTVQIDNPGAANPIDGNDKLWADGDIALATTDVVSGSWSLRPRASFDPVTLTAAEDAWFTASAAPSYPASRDVLEYVKAANQSLLRNYSLTAGSAWSGLVTDGNQPHNRAGRNTVGLIPEGFAALYF